MDVHRPDGWAEGARALLAEYELLASEHTLCTKHRRPKENLAALLAALREAVTPEGSTCLAPRTWGPLQYAVTSVLRKRGRPGTPKHTALRASQAEHAALPTHDLLARLLATRLGTLPRHTREILTPVLAGLRQAAAGHTPVEEEGRVHGFLGWSHRRHWVLRVLNETVPRAASGR